MLETSPPPFLMSPAADDRLLTNCKGQLFELFRLDQALLSCSFRLLYALRCMPKNECICSNCSHLPGRAAASSFLFLRYSCPGFVPEGKGNKCSMKVLGMGMAVVPSYATSPRCSSSVFEWEIDAQAPRGTRRCPVGHATHCSYRGTF